MVRKLRLICYIRLSGYLNGVPTYLGMQSVQEVAPPDHVCHHIEPLAILQEIMDSNHIRVVQTLQGHHFLPQPPHSQTIHAPILFKDLHRILLAGRLLTKGEGGNESGYKLGYKAYL